MPDLTAWLLVFVRVTALLAICPVLSSGYIPVQIRLALGALLSFLTAAFVPIPSLTHAPMGDLIGLIFCEASVGLLLGFICRFIFYAAEMAGSIIANEVGLSMSFVFNPGSQGMVTIPGMILHWTATVLFFCLDLHVWILWGVQRSYQVLGPGVAGISEAVRDNVLLASAGIFVVALQIAAPVLALSFVIMLLFAFLGRLIPQMNAFAESFPTRVLTGLLVFGTAFTVMAQHILNHLNRIPGDFQRILKLLAS